MGQPSTITMGWVAMTSCPIVKCPIILRACGVFQTETPLVSRGVPLTRISEPAWIADSQGGRSLEVERLDQSEFAERRSVTSNGLLQEGQEEMPTCPLGCD